MQVNVYTLQPGRRGRALQWRRCLYLIIRHTAQRPAVCRICRMWWWISKLSVWMYLQVYNTAPEWKLQLASANYKRDNVNALFSMWLSCFRDVNLHHTPLDIRVSSATKHALCSFRSTSVRDYSEARHKSYSNDAQWCQVSCDVSKEASFKWKQKAMKKYTCPKIDVINLLQYFCWAVLPASIWKQLGEVEGRMSLSEQLS